jgi:outer membrane biogenesis lipoprotein LolB
MKTILYISNSTAGTHDAASVPKDDMGGFSMYALFSLLLYACLSSGPQKQNQASEAQVKEQAKLNPHAEYILTTGGKAQWRYPGKAI